MLKTIVVTVFTWTMSVFFSLTAISIVYGYFSGEVGSSDFISLTIILILSLIYISLYLYYLCRDLTEQKNNKKDVLNNE